MTEERHFKQAARLAHVHGFGIDRTALAADALRSDWPVLRMENLDTDLPLPPEAIPETISGLEKPGLEQLAPIHRRHGPARRDLRFHARAHRPPL